MKADLPPERDPLLAKFEGDAGRRRFIEAIKEQKFVQGNQSLAELLASSTTPTLIAPGDTIIRQGEHDDSLFMILSGSFDVSANGKLLARRFATDTVGEMAAIQPTQPRSATVAAVEPSWVAQIEESALSQAGQEYPFIWRFFAKELSRRLLQRNSLLPDARDQTRVFIISSAEAIEIGRAVQNAFAHDPFVIKLWTDGVFKISNYAIESLEAELDKSDFAIAIAQPDDLTTTRNVSSPSPRDNVIFELGFFMGRLGRHRAILLEPRGEEVKLPSDLTGIQSVPYRFFPGADLAADMAPACNSLREIFRDLGPLS